MIKNSNFRLFTMKTNKFSKNFKMPREAKNNPIIKKFIKALSLKLWDILKIFKKMFYLSMNEKLKTAISKLSIKYRMIS